MLLRLETIFELKIQIVETPWTSNGMLAHRTAIKTYLSSAFASGERTTTTIETKVPIGAGGQELGIIAKA